jgi:NADPH:quinone reductase-like Zn-dependent oxidoreductase
MNRLMRAIVHDRYGPPDVLRLEDVPRPVPADDELLVPLLALVTRRLGGKRVTLGITRYSKEDVLFLKRLIEAGEYRAVIDRTYPLEEVIEATKYVETEQKTGNVVLTLGR